MLKPVNKVKANLLFENTNGNVKLIIDTVINGNIYLI